ncbi:hypothetical protein [Mesorhizobium xinjiangense]|uniref:hypothetical protein n=1 Tax=Mesorhizobium xinjiangense TaxID=2678685 RepID=UPI0012ED70A1|nr:hypothetical protein [Mesorhizobium xinjiangense]
MTKHQSVVRSIAIAGTILAAWPQFALAADAEAVAARLKAVVEKQGGLELDWSAVSGDGTDAVRIEGVKLTNIELQNTIGLGDIAMSGIEEVDGGFAVDEMTVAPSIFDVEGAEVNMDELTLTGVAIPGEDTDASSLDVLIYDTLALPKLSVDFAGKQVFALTNLNGEISEEDAGEKLRMTGGVESFSADLSLIEDPKAKDAIDELGFTTLSGNLAAEGWWTPEDGRTVLERYDITVNDAGTLGLTMDLGGYTPELIASLQELGAKMESATEEEKSAAGLSMMGLLQQLTLHGAKIRFDDNTLTDKVLAYIAAQQGVEPKDIANQAKAILPFALAALQNSNLTTAISEAVNAYLDNPDNLEIGVEPEKPVPFAMIAASAMASPQSLPEQLNLTVKANQ